MSDRMNDSIEQYVASHTERGECNCGHCFDRGDRPDPTGHCADVAFFKVAARNAPSADEFARLTAAHRGHYGDCDPLDGNEHGYIELGGWIGDQGLALQYMALGALLGVFTLMTPRSMLGADLPDDLAQEMAGAGYVTIKRVEVPGHVR